MGKDVDVCCNLNVKLVRWFVYYNRLRTPSDHSAHSSLHKESPAELILLTFVWDKTASGTARSKKRVEANRLLAVVWDETVSGTARSKTQVLLKVDALNS